MSHLVRQYVDALAKLVVQARVFAYHFLVLWELTLNFRLENIQNNKLHFTSQSSSQLGKAAVITSRT